MTDDTQTIQPEGWQVALSEEARGLREKRRSRKGGTGEIASFEERFWGKVEKLGNESGCWLWTGAVTHDCYGRVQFQRKARLTNRISWIIHQGPIPEGMGVLHRCDTPECVRPSHLFLGTPKDNTRDMYRKGRAGTIGDRNWTRRFPEKVCRGETAVLSKLKEAQVLEIRNRFASGEKGVVLAKHFKVSRSVISNITKGRIWKHVGGPLTHRFYRKK